VGEVVQAKSLVGEFVDGRAADAASNACTMVCRDAPGGAYSIALWAMTRNPTEPQLPSGPKTCDSPAAPNGALNVGLPRVVPTTVTRQKAF